MRCMNCEAEIPAAYISAIEKNECPGCGDHIQSEETVELMQGLADAIKRMPNDPLGISAWLLSNYRFQKIGQEEPPERFYRKQARQQQPDHQDFKMAKNPVQEMLARTDQYQNIQQTRAKINSKQQQLARMAQNIAEGSVDEAMYGEEPEQEVELEQEEYYPQEEVQAPRQGRALENTSIVDPSAAPLSPDDLAALSQQVEGGEGQEDDLSSVRDPKARQALQLQRMKRLKAQQSVAGGGGGSFRRSS